MAGCNSSASIFVQADGTHWSGGTILANAKFLIGRTAIYNYELTYASVPPQPGAQPQVCFPLGSFELVDRSGRVELEIPSPKNKEGEASGSFYFTTGMWTGVSEGSIEVAGGGLGPSPPTGTSWALACPWSLTLTPSN
jgi:hypothetical protein